MNTAIEVEYWLVTEDGDLTTPGPLTDVSEYVEPEFVEPMLEIKTTPCESVAELREELFDRVRRVSRVARQDGKRLVPLGTPIHASQDELAVRESVRTELQRRIVGPPFDDARYCAGTHVHFEQVDGRVADQLNTLTALDPAFALVNTSSYYRGERILECARPYLYRKGCYAGCPDQGQLWPYVETVDEWTDRLETAFDGFRETARDRGADVATFDEEFHPHNAVWTPVKFREAFPTVEWRSPDIALPSEVIRLTADVRSVVEEAVEFGTEIEGDGTASATDDSLSLPSFETVDRVVNAAMHDGVQDPAVTAYLRRFGFEPDRYDPAAGTSRAARVSRERARQLRLEAADRLEADLEQAPIKPDVRTEPPSLGHSSGV